mmetsp:Transcript_142088/g.250567  ORF Transcript_142088/g.250567 Transcript_142088/m.250567 type:complete len:536 (-) Transcript_142088:30-1637(-)
MMQRLLWNWSLCTWALHLNSQEVDSVTATSSPMVDPRLTFHFGVPSTLRSLAALLLAPASPAATWQVVAHQCDFAKKRLGGGSTRQHSLGSFAWRYPRHACVSMQIVDALAEKSPADARPVNSHHLSFQNVVRTLEADISKIFHKEPNWDVFAEDVKVIGSSGLTRTRVEGLGSNKLLLKLMRRICAKFGVKDELQVTVNGDFDGSLDVSWKGLLNGLRIHSGEEEGVPFLRFVEAETKFYLNNRNQVVYVMIEKLHVNGQPFHWPELMKSDQPAVALKKIMEWLELAKDITDVQPELAPDEAVNQPDPVHHKGELQLDLHSVEFQDDGVGLTVTCDDTECVIQESIHAYAVLEGTLNTGHQVWDAGRLMSKLLLSPEYSERLPGMRVLELGSGTGIGGVTAAAAGAKVLLTDGSEGVLPLLDQNLKNNNLESNAKVCQLLWGEEPEDIVHESGPYDLIIGSDLLYHTSSFPSLLDSLEELCVPGRTEVLFTFPHRTHEDQFLHDAVQRKFKLLRPKTEVEYHLYTASLQLQVAA